MFPWIYEFRWEVIHLAFLGAFFGVILLLALFVGIAVRRALLDLRRGQADALRWSEDFHDLAAAARTCRHTLSGEIKDRLCDKGFDCRTCAQHAELVRRHGEPAFPDGGASGDGPSRYGIDLPLDRLYHRGHTWVRPNEDGTVTIGLDDLAARLIGPGGEVRLPPIGTRIAANGTAWRVRLDDAELRVLAPVDGIVVETGGAERGWYLRLRPAGKSVDTRHLLRGAEVPAWMLKELERLQQVLGNGRSKPALANGGEPAPELWKAVPAPRRDAVLGDFFLDP
jgi:hypothetical protein